MNQFKTTTFEIFSYENQIEDISTVFLIDFNQGRWRAAPGKDPVQLYPIHTPLLFVQQLIFKLIF